MNEYKLLQDTNYILGLRIQNLQERLDSILSSENWNIARKIDMIKTQKKIKMLEKRIAENKLKMEEVK